MSASLESALNVSLHKAVKPDFLQKANIQCSCSIGLIPIALVVIGALAASGVMSSLTFGASAIALAGLAILGSLALAATSQKRNWVHLIEALIYVAITTLAALVITGMLPMSTVSYCVIGLAGVTTLISAAWVFIRA